MGVNDSQISTIHTSTVIQHPSMLPSKGNELAKRMKAIQKNHQVAQLYTAKIAIYQNQDINWVI